MFVKEIERCHCLFAYHSPRQAVRLKSPRLVSYRHENCSQFGTRQTVDGTHDQNAPESEQYLYLVLSLTLTTLLKTVAH